MKERPILFQGDMVRAILAGTKTQTRRVIRPRPPEWVVRFGHTDFTPPGQISARDNGGNESFFKCPFGVPGDRLWVRESCEQLELESVLSGSFAGYGVVYSADRTLVRNRGGDEHPPPWFKKSRCPSIHMPRWASRILLEITDVRVQRVLEITEWDAIAEGIAKNPVQENTWINYAEKSSAAGWRDPRESYRTLWNSINAKRGYGWEVNPWVWAITFGRVTRS